MKSDQRFKNLIPPTKIMSLEEQFKKSIEEWRRYYFNDPRTSSFNPARVGSKEYKRIVAMGVQTLPLIRRLYDEKDDDKDPMDFVQLETIKLHGLPRLIHDLVPEFSFKVGEIGSGAIVEEVGGGFVGIKVREMQEATIKWLDENIPRYMKQIQKSS